MTKISLVVITLNEEKNLERCLESVRGVVDEIVIVDSFSKDRTPEIARKFQALFIQKDWMGYSETKNFGNAKASSDWILSLDADEALSVELRESLMSLKGQAVMRHATFNRMTQYCGSWIKHSGWYPDRKLRVFDRRVTKWVGEIHEQLVAPPEQVKAHLAGDCLHYSYYSVSEHLAQTDKFTSLSAQDLFQKGKRSSPFKRFVSPLATFLKNYVLKFGFLDGLAGIRVCVISAWSVHLKYSKLRSLEQK